MDDSSRILSDIIVFSKYARYIPKLQRRENWEEIIDRYGSMMIEKYPKKEDEIVSHLPFLKDKKVVPSMRMLQFAGIPVLRNESRGYNCSYIAIDDYKAFSEIMFLLLSGTGVGFSVQSHHINNLPLISRAEKTQKYLVADNIEGWSDAIRHLIGSYLGKRKFKPKFDFSDIRPKGSELVTSGSVILPLYIEIYIEKFGKFMGTLLKRQS